MVAVGASGVAVGFFCGLFVGSLAARGKLTELRAEISRAYAIAGIKEYDKFKDL